MRMTITVEDAGQAPQAEPAPAAVPAAEAVTVPQDAGGAPGGASAPSSETAPGESDGGSAPAWLVELIEEIGAQSPSLESSGEDAGAGPSA